MKNGRFKKTLAWMICVCLTLSCFTVAFAENTGDKAKAVDKVLNVSEQNKDAEKTEENPDIGKSGDEVLPADPSAEVVKENNTVKEEPVKNTVDFGSFKDVSGHWAIVNLKKAVEDGLLNGFEDGTLRPDAQITLAQMITIIVRILKPELKEKSGVAEGKWYTEYADKAVALGIIDSSKAGSINDPMNRKAACAMIAEAFQLCTADPDRTAASKFSDFGNLTFDEKIVFASLVEGGLLEGYDGSLMLSKSITRAEFVTILYRIAGKYSSAEADFDASGTVLSSGNVDLKDIYIPGNLWIDATAKKVNIDNTKAKSIVIRSDSLDSLSVKNSGIERLVIAARSGTCDIDCTSINTTVVGSGGGKVRLVPGGNNVEITGSGRHIVISGNTGEVAVSGDYNTIIFENDADADSVVVNGKSNSITLDSRVNSLKLTGKENKVKGTGQIEVLTLNTGKSSIDVTTVETINKIDNGIDGMKAVLSGPATAYSGKYLTIRASLSQRPEEEKAVMVKWTINGTVVKTDDVILGASTELRLDYYISGTGAIPAKYDVDMTVTYVTIDGDVQTVKAVPVSVEHDKNDVNRQAAIVNSIQTVYKGNRTTQWAIDHDYSKEVKELFVNYKGYSSSSKYLIWVNIGTQHTMVFEGSKGKWKLIRSGLVSTGAGDCTPRGVFKTTYKQTNWTTSTYTVKPIVRFYGGGYAFHSRLYQPGTTTLKGGANGVGYPLSHGCVRMQADDINWLYNNVPDGTTVVVY